MFYYSYSENSIARSIICFRNKILFRICNTEVTIEIYIRVFNISNSWVMQRKIRKRNQEQIMLSSHCDSKLFTHVQFFTCHSTWKLPIKVI